VNQSVKDGFESVGAWFKDLGSGGSKMQDFVKATQAFRIEILKLREDLQGVTLDEQDFIEISNDVTIGFQERNAALEKSIELSKERTAIAVDIAQKEFNLAAQALEADSARITSGSVDIELLKKKAELEGIRDEHYNRLNFEITELDIAIDNLLGKQSWIIGDQTAYDDENHDYIKSSQEEI